MIIFDRQAGANGSLFFRTNLLRLLRPCDLESSSPLAMLFSTIEFAVNQFFISQFPANK